MASDEEGERGERELEQFPVPRTIPHAKILDLAQSPDKRRGDNDDLRVSEIST